MPARHKRQPVTASRLITVLQGWDASEKEIAAQQRIATEAGAGGVLISLTPIEQSWKPRLFKFK